MSARIPIGKRAVSLSRRFRSERGAADPILSMAGIAVTGIVAASIVGALVMVINLGANYVKEQTLSTAASQAQTAFAKDAQNSSAVSFGDDQAVAFIEEASRASAMSTTRGRPYTCRLSEWDVTGLGASARLENYVSITNKAGGDPCTKFVDSDRTLLTTVPLVAGSASFQFTNAAGQDIEFTEDGDLAEGKTNPGDYWSKSEWESTAPRTIAFTAKTELPLAGTRDVKLSGRTWLAAGAPGLVDPRTPPGAELYTLTSVENVTYDYGTTGAIWGGEKESLKISWDKASCGPNDIAYDVVWAPEVGYPSAPRFERSIAASAAATHSVEFSPVPHGTVAEVSIIASCVDGEVDPADPQYTASHQTAVPAPVATAETKTDEVHEVSWLPVSSLPTLYTVQGAEKAGATWGAWTKTAVIAETTAASAYSTLKQSVTWPSGTTNDRWYKYHVKGEPLSLAQTRWSNEPSFRVPPADPAAIPLGGPAASTFTVGVARGSTGATFAGARESIAVSFAASTCGPYKVKHTVSWAPKTAGAKALTQTFAPSFTKSYTSKLSPVPNGVKGTVTVLAECDSAGVASTSMAKAKSYTQPLPAPKLKAAVRNRYPHIHDMSWMPVSSLATSYQVTIVQGATSSKGFSAIKTSAGRTKAVSTKATYAVGVTYGTTKKYKVKATVAGPVSATSSTVSLTTARPTKPNGAVTITSIDRYGFSFKASGCQAGTRLDYRERWRWGSTNLSATGWSGWSAKTYRSAATSQGSRITVQAQARCVAPYSTSKDAVTSATRSFSRPAAPTPVYYPAPRPGPGTSPAPWVDVSRGDTRWAMCKTTVWVEAQVGMMMNSPRTWTMGNGRALIRGKWTGFTMTHTKSVDTRVRLMIGGLKGKAQRATMTTFTYGAGSSMGQSGSGVNRVNCS